MRPESVTIQGDDDAAQAVSPPDDEPGRSVPDRIAGRYRVQGLLGQGGFGAVYQALDELEERTVAVKLIRRDIASDPRLTQTAHDSSQVVSFEVELDPRIAAEGITAADLQEQAAFLAQVSGVQVRARELQKKVRDRRGQLEGLIEAAGADAAAARRTNEKLVAIQDRLTNQPGGRYVQPMLVSQLSYLSSNAGRADQAPGNHAYMRLEFLEKELKSCEAAFAKIDGPVGKPPRRSASRRGK